RRPWVIRPGRGRGSPETSCRARSPARPAARSRNPGGIGPVAAPAGGGGRRQNENAQSLATPPAVVRTPTRAGWPWSIFVDRTTTGFFSPALNGGTLVSAVSGGGVTGPP